MTREHMILIVWQLLSLISPVAVIAPVDGIDHIPSRVEITAALHVITHTEGR